MVFKTFYDFFKLPEKEAYELIGTSFTESNPYPKKHKFHYAWQSGLYFPIGLSNPWENYGHAVGLIFVSPIWPATKHYSTWFRCGLASPDDGDCDLDFLNDEIKYRKKVINFMYSMPWYDTSIKEVLVMVQDHVKGGKLNC